MNLVLADFISTIARCDTQLRVKGTLLLFETLLIGATRSQWDSDVRWCKLHYVSLVEQFTFVSMDNFNYKVRASFSYLCIDSAPLNRTNSALHFFNHAPVLQTQPEAL